MVKGFILYKVKPKHNTKFATVHENPVLRPKQQAPFGWEIVHPYTVVITTLNSLP